MASVIASTAVGSAVASTGAGTVDSAVARAQMCRYVEICQKRKTMVGHIELEDDDQARMHVRTCTRVH